MRNACGFRCRIRTKIRRGNKASIQLQYFTFNPQNGVFQAQIKKKQKINKICNKK